MSISNVDQVKQAIVGFKGGKFTLASVNIDGLSRDQISKALRSIKHVKSLGRGNYVIKGRKV